MGKAFQKDVGPKSLLIKEIQPVQVRYLKDEHIFYLNTVKSEGVKFFEPYPFENLLALISVAIMKKYVFFMF